jgi:hypothetical protein
MESIQAYETTVADRTHAWMARFVIIPQRAFPNEVAPTNEDSLRQLFSFATLQQLTAASALPRALAVLVAHDETEQFPVPAGGSPTVSLRPHRLSNQAYFSSLRSFPLPKSSLSNLLLYRYKPWLRLRLKQPKAAL